jgi:hypothetical protein
MHLLVFIRKSRFEEDFFLFYGSLGSVPFITAQYFIIYSVGNNFENECSSCCSTFATKYTPGFSCCKNGMMSSRLVDPCCSAMEFTRATTASRSSDDKYKW